MNGQLILSLFPGGGLWDKAFQDNGFTVVKGPDLLWGEDIQDFHVPVGRFDGIIGGPPCQSFSIAKGDNQSKRLDMIPEYLRVVNETKPRWAIMENVLPAVNAETAPEWPIVKLRDYDCGGLTFRMRAFWFYGIKPAIKPPIRKDGKAGYSVITRSWDMTRPGMHSQLKWDEASRLQGMSEKGQTIYDAMPHNFSKTWWSNFIVHLMGNGVPYAMGDYIAKHVMDELGLTGSITRENV